MNGRMTIDEELCKGCNYCVLACPKKLLELKREFNSKGFFPSTITDSEACNGCALCAVVCPEIAIEVWREETADAQG